MLVDRGEDGDKGPDRLPSPRNPMPEEGLGSASPLPKKVHLLVILRHSGEGHDWPTKCGPLV